MILKNFWWKRSKKSLIEMQKMNPKWPFSKVVVSNGQFLNETSKFSFLSCFSSVSNGKKYKYIEEIWFLCWSSKIWNIFGSDMQWKYLCFILQLTLTITAYRYTCVLSNKPKLYSVNAHIQPSAFIWHLNALWCYIFCFVSAMQIVK